MSWSAITFFQLMCQYSKKRSHSNKIHSDAANTIQNLCMINKEFSSDVENSGILSWKTGNSALRQENRKVTSPYFLCIIL